MAHILNLSLPFLVFVSGLSCENIVKHGTLIIIGVVVGCIKYLFVRIYVN